MAEIYGDLPSPTVDLLNIGSHSDSDTIREVIEHGTVPGLRSSLYRYQKNTVAAMIDRELNPHDAPDPHVLPLMGLDGKVFYFQPARMEITRERARIARSCGGVLCEELGKPSFLSCMSKIDAEVIHCGI